MLPGLAYVYGKVLQRGSSRGELCVPLNTVIRLRLMRDPGKGRVACGRNGHERIGEIRKLVTYFHQLREIACSPDSDLP